MRHNNEADLLNNKLTDDTDSLEGFCEPHKQKASVYCKKCQKALCGDCLLDHKEHNYTTIKEIETEILALTKQQHTSGEKFLKTLEEKQEVLLKGIEQIRFIQEQREVLINKFLKNAKDILTEKHKEIFNKEEEKIARLTFLSFQMTKKINFTKAELEECKEKLRGILKVTRQNRMTKAFKLISDHKIFSFEKDHIEFNEEEFKAECNDGVKKIFKGFPKINFDEIIQISDVYKAGYETLQENMNQAKDELAELRKKSIKLLERTKHIKGIVYLILYNCRTGRAVQNTDK